LYVIMHYYYGKYKDTVKCHLMYIRLYLADVGYGYARSKVV